MKTKKKIIYVIVGIFLVVCIAFGVTANKNIDVVVNDEQNTAETIEDTLLSQNLSLAHGSAESLEGTTIVVSLFADDTTTSWDSSDEDKTKINNINNYLKIAGKYLENVASDYDKEATCITDFNENDDLKYNISFEQSITNQTAVDSGELDTAVWKYIDENIKEDELKQKYNADNVVYMLFVDSDETNTAISCTRNWYEGMPYDYEIVYLFNVDCGVTNCPAVYAHEILHTFGAPDLYTTDTELNITDKFLNYVSKRMPNDLMLTCSDEETGEYSYDSITNEVDEVTAYYVGLIDSSNIVNEWNLGLSQHVTTE